MNTVEPIRLIDGEGEGSQEIEKDKVYLYLLAKGVNHCGCSYNSEDKDYAKRFSELPLSDIAPLWQLLSDGIKLSVLNENIEEFNRMMAGVCDE